ncbi:hypothetical protein BDR22DRAFT_824558 [Usnea florida]
MQDIGITNTSSRNTHLKQQQKQQACRLLIESLAPNLESPGRRKHRILSDSSKTPKRHEINISEPIPIDPPRYSKPIGVLRPHQTFHFKVEVPICCLHPPSIKPRSINYQPYHQAYDSSSHSDTAIFDWERRSRGGNESNNTHQHSNFTRSSSLDCGKDAYQDTWNLDSFEFGPALCIETDPKDTTLLWDLVRTSSRAESLGKGSAGIKNADPGPPSHKRKRGLSLKVEEAGPAVPLTEKALKKHLKATMSSNQTSCGDNPSTPQYKNGFTNSVTSPVPPLSNKSKTSQPAYSLRRHMEKHGIWRDKNTLEEPEHAIFRDTVMEVVNNERASGVRNGSQRKFKNHLEWIPDDNEDTVMTKLLPCIIKDGRGKRASFADNASAQQDHAGEAAMKEYMDDGLQFSVNRQFSETYLPLASADTDFKGKVASKLAKGRGIKQAKPDRIYGLNLDQFRTPKDKTLRPQTESWVTLVPNMTDSFLVFEGKASNGNLAKACEQASRVGTCLVFAQRELLDHTGHVDKQGADDRTYVYSATMDANCWHFWVHFAVVAFRADGTKDVNYHMECIYSTTYRQEDSLLRLRRVCHNILDWGLGARKKMLEKRYESIYDYDERWSKQESQKIDADTQPVKRRKKNNGSSTTG